MSNVLFSRYEAKILVQFQVQTSRSESTDGTNGKYVQTFISWVKLWSVVMFWYGKVIGSLLIMLLTFNQGVID